MSVSKSRLTVYFEPPFWVALYQREAQRERKLALRQKKRREKHKGH